MRIFFDTEFIERGPGHAIELVSIGMVREDGKEYYAVNGNVSSVAQRYAATHEWLGPNVWAHLPTVRDEHDTYDVLDQEHDDVKQRDVIAAEVSAFCADGLTPGQKAELWAYYADYDHVVLAQSFGTMLDLPAHMPMYTHDIKQEADRLDIKLPEQQGGEHHALADARWNVIAWKALQLAEELDAGT